MTTSSFARAGRRFLAPCLILFACAGAASADGLYAVGLRQTHTIASTETPAVPLAIWYPAVAAQEDAAPAPGPFPVILLSHGSGGSEFGHADWAAYLAAHGYIVAAPRHLGDSYDQPNGRGSDVQLIGRVWQAQAALDTVLGDTRLRPAMAAGRVGMLGYSAGGYTTLVMAGARPDFSLWHTHCEAHTADDTELCPRGVWQSLPRITRPGHYVFLAPCPADLLARRPELCTDAAGVDRVAIHRQMEAELLDFFNANL
jgi:predicted dienelactone hydrolase